MIKISPSVLASDFSRLGDEAKKMEKYGAELLHLDVMDGSFVPNISFGAPVIKSVRKCSKAVFDVHLMIDEPIRYIDDFVNAGADIITVHVEACSDIEKTLDKIISSGCKAALSVKPKTDIESVYPYLDKTDMILVMTVEPGFGGQKFMDGVLPKIEKLRLECEKRNISMDIEVDGGIDKKTIPLASKAGANVFVAGSSIFGAEDAKKAIEELKSSANLN